MEAIWRWVLVGAIAPVAWGSTYAVTRATLPPDSPLWGALLRALPAGVVLVLIVRSRPRGSWWWKSFVLGALNVGGFFVLVYVVAQLLPSGTAATIMSLSAAVMALLGWAVLSERPTVAALVGAAGVGIMVAGGGGTLRIEGLAASVVAMLSSSLGFVLTKRWLGDERVLAVTAWQLLAGAALLAPVAVAVESGPPPLDAAAIGAVAYVALPATALAYTAWFTALSHLPAGTVGIVGLLNPVTGVLLGALIGGEALGPPQITGVGLVIVGILIARRNRTLPQGCRPLPAAAPPPSPLLSSSPAHRRRPPGGTP